MAECTSKKIGAKKSMRSTMCEVSLCQNIPVTTKHTQNFDWNILKKNRESMSNEKLLICLKKYSKLRSYAHKWAKGLIGDDETLVFIGDANTASNSPMKGYGRTTAKHMINALQNHKKATVVEVDEFRSTKLCYKCHQPHFVSHSPHRYVFCPNSHNGKIGLVSNRDVAAGINIKNLGIKMVEGRASTDLHVNFGRNHTPTGDFIFNTKLTIDRIKSKQDKVVTRYKYKTTWAPINYHPV